MSGGVLKKKRLYFFKSSMLYCLPQLHQSWFNISNKKLKITIVSLMVQYLVKMSMSLVKKLFFGFLTRLYDGIKIKCHIDIQLYDK